MKLIIDIDEDTYKYMQSRCKYQNKSDKGLSKFEEAGVAIKNGTLLPKGYGRILDERDILDTENNDGGWYDLVDMPEYIAGVKAIIEADKAESEVQK